MLKISQKVHDNVEGKLNKKQREFYLRQQMAAIKEELGEKDAGEDDEMTQIMAPPENLGLVDPDDAPEPPDEAVTRPGIAA